MKLDLEQGKIKGGSLRLFAFGDQVSADPSGGAVGYENRTRKEHNNEYGNLLFWYCAFINESTL